MSTPETKPASSPGDDLAVRALRLASRTAIAMLGPGELSKDVAQDVALRVLERKSQLRDPDRFDAWVHRIAARESVRAGKHRAAQRASERTWDDEAAASIESPDNVAQRVCGHEEALRALSLLSERERMAMTLRYVHDLKDVQIAHAMRCRRGTVNSLLSRARSRLRAADATQPQASLKEIPQ